jgi:DNA primase
VFDLRQAIEEVKLKNPIEEVVRERVPTLRKAGALWVACCPFHEEKTPSFKVDPRRGTWHCYGACSAGGDQLAFVERSYNVGFREALDILAARAGVKLPENAPRRDEGHLAPLYGCLRAAEETFRRQLRGPRGAGARDYLRGRGLAEATLEAFGVGLALSGAHSLAGRALEKGLALRALEAAGLVRRGDDGRPYDFFRERITFPVRDLKGRTVGFGARRLSDADPRVPKYVNTPETELFHKGRLFYALDRALEPARRSGRLILMEGYTDVMAAHQVGIGTAVAVLGTATTEEHAALVRRTGARRVDLVFDGDEAGRRATLRALQGLLSLDVDLRITRLAGDADPCDFLIQRGSGPFMAELERAKPWFEFLVEGLLGVPPGERWRAADTVLGLIARVPRPVQRDELLGILAERLGTPLAGLREQYASLPERRRQAARAVEAAARRGGPSAPEARASERGAYEDLVGAALLEPELALRLGRHAESCPEEDLRRILEALVDLCAGAGAGVGVDRVLIELGEHPARERVVPLLERAATAESPRELFEGAARALGRRAEDQAIREQIAEVGNGADEGARLAELHRQLRARVN